MYIAPQGFTGVSPTTYSANFWMGGPGKEGSTLLSSSKATAAFSARTRMVLSKNSGGVSWRMVGRAPSDPGPLVGGLGGSKEEEGKGTLDEGAGPDDLGGELLEALLDVVEGPVAVVDDEPTQPPAGHQIPVT